MHKFLFLLFLFSCNRANQNDARLYFDDVIKVMNPFVITTNNVVAEMGQLGKSYRANGKKFRPSDSLKIVTLLDSFNAKTKETLTQLKNLKTFNDFDLKNPSIKYVESLSRLMNLTLTEFLNHNLARKKTENEVSETIDTWKTDLVTAKEDFDLVQSNFKEKFKVE